MGVTYLFFVLQGTYSFFCTLVTFFSKKLLNSLKVPLSRANHGTNSEILPKYHICRINVITFFFML